MESREVLIVVAVLVAAVCLAVVGCLLVGGTDFRLVLEESDTGFKVEVEEHGQVQSESLPAADR